MSFFTVSPWIREIRETRERERERERFTGLNDMCECERKRAEERAFYSDGRQRRKRSGFLLGKKAF
jgi:hypothetical protein